MATNRYFSNNPQEITSEQLMREDLFAECIQIQGIDTFYIPRGSNSSTPDLVIGEDPTSKFTETYQIEMYLENPEGWTGGGDILEKFGLSVLKTTDFMVSARSFRRWIPSIARPRVGDLIYVPVMRKLFEITFTEDEEDFFTLGRRDPVYYKVSCEIFKYSEEDLDTGHKEIDEIEPLHSYNQLLKLSSGTGNYNIGEYVYQGATFAEADARGEVSNWFPANTTIMIHNIRGVFTVGETIIGNSSNTQYTVGSYDKFDDVVIDSDNREIQISANSFLQFDETNPFGSIGSY